MVAQFSSTALVFCILVLKLPTILFVPLPWFTQSVFCDKASWQSTVSVMKRKLHLSERGSSLAEGVCSFYPWWWQTELLKVSFLHENEEAVQLPFFEVFKTRPDEALSSLVWAYCKNLTWLLRTNLNSLFRFQQCIKKHAFHFRTRLNASDPDHIWKKQVNESRLLTTSTDSLSEK